MHDDRMPAIREDRGIAMNAERSSLLDAIARALGERGPYEETRGDLEQAISLGNMFSAPIVQHREVLGGATDSAGRVAWASSAAARLAALPPYSRDDKAYDADVERAREAAITIELPR
jgi:hypothetical protein